MPTQTCYSNKAENTKTIRRARGLYKRPTQLQCSAWKKAMQSRRLYGEPVFTQEELEALSTHPMLTASQRAEYNKKLQAQSVNWQ